MNFVKINGEKIGLKSNLKVAATQKNVRLAMQFMKDNAEVDLDQKRLNNRKNKENKETYDPEYFVNNMDLQMKAIDLVPKFLTMILHLDKKEISTIDNADFSELKDFALNLALKVLGINPSGSETSRAK